MKKRKFNWDKIRKFLDSVSDESTLYVGVDSQVYKKNGVWYANYFKVIVVHIDSCRGCKIFGETDTEIDYNQNKKRPLQRLMNEVYKVSELYLKLAEHTDKEIFVHLDINPSDKHVSSLVLSQAIGYIKGVCDTEPVVKPDSWAAAHAADRFLRTSYHEEL